MNAIIFLFAVSSLLTGAWKLYMMVNHPDTYLKMREQDRQRKGEIFKSVGKAAAPTAFKMATKFLKW